MGGPSACPWTGFSPTHISCPGGGAWGTEGPSLSLDSRGDEPQADLGPAAGPLQTPVRGRGASGSLRGADAGVGGEGAAHLHPGIELIQAGKEEEEADGQLHHQCEDKHIWRKEGSKRTLSSSSPVGGSFTTAILRGWGEPDPRGLAFWNPPPPRPPYSSDAQVA